MSTALPAPRLASTARRLVLLPIGSVEQHGPYLPVDTDLRIAQLLATKLAESFPDPEPLLLPVIPFSCSWEHQGLGTIALNVGTLAAMLHDVARSLRMWEAPCLLLLVNWHGGNDLLGALATELTATEGIPSAVIPALSQVGKAWDESAMTTAKEIHGGAVETAIVQAFWPDLVPRELPVTTRCEPDIAPAKAQAVLQALGTRAITAEGIWGAPGDAKRYKGKKLVVALVQRMHDQAEKLLALVEERAGERHWPGEGR